ncbi:MAG TPA: pyridoxal-phosphate dependent enzyme [Roseiflexaceae bacterium]|nr:pyridoxal-phosphate dependent enzyme [Roseiflexaceae bacterium]
MLTIDDVLVARQVIDGRLHRTPLVGSAALSAMIGAPLYLKLESWQKTGSFKPRGVLNKIAALSPEQRARGLITASAGNHAQALAWAAAAEGLACTVVMPETAPAAKLAATEGYSGTIVLEPSTLTVFTRAQALAAEHGFTFVPPFDDEAIVAGQGTVGLEILDDLPDVGSVVVPIGGGGLIAGIALAIKSRRPNVRIVGVEPRGAAKMWRSRQSGQAERLDKIDTIADGLSAPFAGEIPFALVQQYVDDLVLVDDADIRAAMTLILERCKLLAEPAGAAALAGLLSGAVKPQAPVVAILSGGNVDAARLAQLLTASLG